MDKQIFKPLRYELHGQRQIESVQAALPNLPVGGELLLEVLIREAQKPRKPSQNALMWVGPLADIAHQAWFQGHQFSAEIWHELFKRMYLPEDDHPEIHLLAKESYRKWDYLPSGERVLIGSTTDLLVRGMALYIQQIEAHGADLGVRFGVRPSA